MYSIETELIDSVRNRDERKFGVFAHRVSFEEPSEKYKILRLAQLEAIKNDDLEFFHKILDSFPILREDEDALESFDSSIVLEGLIKRIHQLQRGW